MMSKCISQVKKIKRKKGKSKLYFHEGTQAAIIAFQNSDDAKEREQIYITAIKPAFDKLVENLINIYKFTSLHDSYEDLKHDCVNFLFETIPKYNCNKGTNAFSYFNVVGRNWLVIRAKNKASRLRKIVSIDDPCSITLNDLKIIEEQNIIQSQDILLENASTAVHIIDVLDEIRNRVCEEHELLCINAIIDVFKNIDNLELLNKSALLLYIRENSGLTSKQMITTMHTIKKHYKRIKNEPKFKF